MEGWEHTLQHLTGETRGRCNLGEVVTASGRWFGELRWHGSAVSVTDDQKITTWVRTTEIMAVSTFPGRVAKR